MDRMHAQKLLSLTTATLMLTLHHTTVASLPNEAENLASQQQFCLQNDALWKQPWLWSLHDHINTPMLNNKDAIRDHCDLNQTNTACNHLAEDNIDWNMPVSSAASSESPVNPVLIGVCATLPIMATAIFMLCMRCREPSDADLEYYANGSTASPYVYYNPSAGADELPVSNGGSASNNEAKDVVILNPATLHLSTSDSIHYKSGTHNNNLLPPPSRNNPVVLTNIYYRHDL